jgi:hypothetical protein
VVGNSRENILTIIVTVFFSRERMRERKSGRENEFDITGYQERKITIGNVLITIGNVLITIGNR